MSAFKGTPGEWRIDANGIGIDSTNGYGVCVCAGGLPGDEAELSANAALIAAAPDMLKALVAMLDGCASADYPLVQFGGDPTPIARAINRARHILAALREGGAL